MPLQSMLLPHCLFPQLGSVASWGVPYDKLAKEEKFQAWFKMGLSNMLVLPQRGWL